jgi:hypothetical protein
LVTLSPAETETLQAADDASRVDREPAASNDYRTMEVRITDEDGQPLAGC